MDIPKNESSFTLDYIGETTGQKYDGTFTVRTALTMGQKHILELEKSKLLADFINPTQELAGIALILSNLRVKIISAPSWWDQSSGGLSIMDEDVLVELYKKTIEKEIEWREALKNKGAKAAAAKEDPTGPNS